VGVAGVASVRFTWSSLLLGHVDGWPRSVCESPTGADLLVHETERGLARPS
jgi:hypothetical protein